MKKMMLIIVAILICNLTGVSNARLDKNYGVFIGMKPKNVMKLRGYKKLVLDGEYFSAKQIKKLHDRGNKHIYSYLNIGSIENFRDYYKDFENITLGNYENWPKEKWIDVSKKSWQKFITEKGRELKKKGIEGFFIDNTDVYYIYPKNKIYEGLLNILKTLRNELKIPLIINGGNVFVEKVLKEDFGKNFIQGINQETVFTAIDFKNKTLKKRTDSDKIYYQRYIRKCKKAGVKVFLLEYTKSRNLSNVIKKYCKKHGYFYYISKSVELDRE